MKSSKEIKEMYKFPEILDLVMSLLCFTDEDCARLFDVSTRTIERWKEGSTEPSDLVKMLLYRTLLFYYGL